jgi:DNA-binding winged helix-turn-helix (wHTH) protein
MDNEPEPTFAKQIQTAVDRGQVVMVPTLTRPPNQSPAPTIPQRDRDEASLTAVLCLLFNLRRSEGQVLMLMATQDYVSKEEIFAAATQNEQTIAKSTVSVLIHALRKKLLLHGIEISTLRGFGYGLRKESRKKICTRLAKYDAGLIPTAPAKPKNSEPDLFESELQASGERG